MDTIGHWEDRPREIGTAQKWKCGLCDKNVATNEAFFARVGVKNGPASAIAGAIVFCPSCQHPTYLSASGGPQIPSERYGNPVDYLPADIEQLYGEARDCTGVGAQTASVMICRKLLMHIAVENGAQTGLSFIEYVDYLEKNGHTPSKSREWVDRIRKKGNEANHQITRMGVDDSHELLDFTEMLLKIVYEYPTRGKKP